MKTPRKAKVVRRKVTRRPAPLSLSMRVERLEKHLLFAPAPSASAVNQRFVNLDANGNPTTGAHVFVRDMLTGLEWLAAPLADGKEMNHADAMKACADLALLGHKDWRAPTVKELLALIDYERNDPAVDPAHFKGPFGYTWSSTIYKGSSGYAWLVDLHYGLSYWNGQSLRCRVRAVRAGQSLGLLG